MHNSTDQKTIAIQIPVSEWEIIKAIADAEKRTVRGQTAFLVSVAVREAERAAKYQAV